VACLANGGIFAWVPNRAAAGAASLDTQFFPVDTDASRVPRIFLSQVLSCRERLGRSSMATQRRLDVNEVGDVTVVRFKDRRILDETSIQELGQELFQLVEEYGRKKLLLNFSSVEFLSSAALGKLITLDKKVKANGGKLKLSNIRTEIYEVFAITKLNKLFDIRDDEADALASF
jgi:anti-sigma B factor antagonist